MSGLPKDPVSMLGEAAIALQEMFVHFVDAGFSKEEALHLVTAAFLSAVKPSDGGER